MHEEAADGGQDESLLQGSGSVSLGPDWEAHGVETCEVLGSTDISQPCPRPQNLSVSLWQRPAVALRRQEHAQIFVSLCAAFPAKALSGEALLRSPNLSFPYGHCCFTWAKHISGPGIHCLTPATELLPLGSGLCLFLFI